MLLAVALLVMLTGVGLFFVITQSTTTNTEPVRIYLPKTDICQAARDTIVVNGLVQDTPVFNLISKVFKLDENWREGSYVVQPGTPIFRLIKRINRGQQDPIRLTIGKFRTPQQLNEYLCKKLMHNDFNVTISTFYLIRPNTYEFYWTVTPEQFMQRMEREYERFWNAREGGKKLDESERINAIILASIIEEETNNKGEKPLIASVYLNRLRIGMPLQADPTVKYAVGDFTLRRILNIHLAVESPYNTYLHAGLPPAPICLPSDASVDAVLNAANTNYLYFCASPALDGTHRFAATLAEHNRNAKQYHAAIR